MDDNLNHASAGGFVLGLLAAEEIHRTPDLSAADQELALFDLILGIADGTRTLIPDDERLVQLVTPTANPVAAREAMKIAALRLVESYRQSFFC